MTKRIVKMVFHADKVEVFKEVYRSNWTHIRNFVGCLHVELLQDENDPRVFFTYSLWESEAHIENYRRSELFGRVWAATKIHFADKPQAWTVKELKFDQ